VNGNNQLAKRDTSDLMQIGRILAQSGMFQDARQEAQAIVKVLAGQEMGFGPIASMTGIYVVKGRVTLSANLIAAAIKRSGRYDYRVNWLEGDGCEVVFFQGKEEIGRSAFTLDDARTAQLAGGENWKKFPRNMCFARALSNGAKWYCPDIFGGPIYTPDELGAEVDGETGEVVRAPVVEVAAPEPEPDPLADFWQEASRLTCLDDQEVKRQVRAILNDMGKTGVPRDEAARAQLLSNLVDHLSQGMVAP
jgi:hypothetical protein